MATVNVRIDDTVKHDAEQILSDIGLALSSAISIYFKQMIRENAVPFPLKASKELEPTEEFATYLHKVDDDIKHNHNLSRSMNKSDLKLHLRDLRK